MTFFHSHLYTYLNQDFSITQAIFFSSTYFITCAHCSPVVWCSNLFHQKPIYAGIIQPRPGMQTAHILTVMANAGISSIVCSHLNMNYLNTGSIHRLVLIPASSNCSSSLSNLQPWPADMCLSLPRYQGQSHIYIHTDRKTWLFSLKQYCQ